MDIIGDRKFVEVPGGKTHELPPLLVKTVPDVKRLDKIMGVASRDHRAGRHGTRGRLR